MNDLNIKRFDFEDIKEFFLAVLKAVKVRDDVAHYVTEGLVSTSLRAVDSHGIRLFPHYIAGVEGGRINPVPNYKFEQTAPVEYLIKWSEKKRFRCSFRVGIEVLLAAWFEQRPPS